MPVSVEAHWARFRVSRRRAIKRTKRVLQKFRVPRLSRLRIWQNENRPGIARITKHSSSSPHRSASETYSSDRFVPSIVCHGASGEKLCCASKQEHCCIYDEKPIKALFYSTLVVVIILGLFLILQCWRWSRPEPSPLRASPSAAPPPEPEPIAQAEVVPYPNR